MAGDKTDRDVEDANKRMNAPAEGDASRRRGEVDTAMTPAAGAPVQHAFAGAALSAEEHAGERGETADAIKRAAENDGRV